LTRDSINDHMKELRRMWSWGVGRGIVTPAQERILKEVKILRRGHPGTTEGKTRRPITPEEFQNALHGASSNAVADMMRCMWYAEFRPTEVCMMRAVEIDRRHKDCWLFIPGRDRFALGEHKTMDHDLPRAIPITAKLQAVLGPRLDACASPTDYLFSPKVATQEMAERKFARRMTALNTGNGPGTNRVVHPMIQPRDHYDNESFCKAVKKACGRGGVDPHFTPYDVRRTTITRIRAIAGKDVAALLTGHTRVETTDIYLLGEVQEAMKAAKEIDERL
jgi:integrase